MLTWTRTAFNDALGRQPRVVRWLAKEFASSTLGSHTDRSGLRRGGLRRRRNARDFRGKPTHKEFDEFPIFAHNDYWLRGAS
jgi:hypothetical protein